MTGNKRTPAGSGRGAPRRLLSLTFLSEEEFTAEYWANLANGGAFLTTTDPFELRDVVDVRLDLSFNGQEIVLEAEVVNVVPEELARAGGTPGVAVHFRIAADEVRQRLGAFAGPPPAKEAARPGEDERRAAPRAPARLTGHLDTSDARLDAHTQDLSRSGVLLSVAGEPVPVGASVRVSLSHPTSGEQMEVDAKVVRHVETADGGTALGICFEREDGGAGAVTSFIEDVQSAEHARRLGGITGPIEELGLANLLKMLSACSPRGTLVVRRQGEEACVVFEQGNLVGARLGRVSGGKVLSRILTWRDGSFEFHAVAGRIPADEPPVPLDAAILDGLREAEERARLEAPGLPRSARLRVRVRVADEVRSSLDKIAEAVLDLAAASFDVGSILDVIPEPDAAIHTALQELLERGLIETVG